MLTSGGGDYPPRLFLAVSTGQRVANLPPILECARAERDAVVWLDSELARKSRWSEGASTVLRKRGYQVFATKDVLDEDVLPDVPAEVTQALIRLHLYCSRHGYEPIWVAHGVTARAEATLPRGRYGMCRDRI